MSDLSESLRLFITNSGRRARLDVGGELELTTVGAFRDRLDVLIESATGDVDVDMALVTFCDATTLAVLVAAHHQLAGVGRRLQVINASRPVVRLVTLTDLDATLLGPTEDTNRLIAGWSQDPRATITPHRTGACTTKDQPDADREARQRRPG